jgi:DNA-binding MarR family transcriptional regulator
MTAPQTTIKKTIKNGLPRLSNVELKALELVRKRGPLSRTELADHLGISRASVTAIAGNLVELEVLTDISRELI